MSFDIVIRNGNVIDGTGSAPVRADVGIRADRIAAIGEIGERGTREIDADGCLVTPGFVDIHAHLDAQIFWDGLATSACWHGITSVVMGNCGVTFAPCHTEDRDTLAHLMESVEDIPAADINAGMNWSWETFGEYLDALENLPLGINVGGMVGHCAVRFWVMGTRALSQKVASKEDILGMQKIVAEAMSRGALGFSTSRTHVHRTPEGEPVPGTFANMDELMGIARTMAEYGTPVFESVPHLDSTDPEVHRAEIQMMDDIARETGLPVTFSYIHTRGNTEGWRDAFAMLDASASRGTELYGQTQVRSLGMLFGLVNNTPWDRAGPAWADLKSQDLEQRLASIRDPQTRKRLVDEAPSAGVPEGLLHVIYKQRVENGDARYDVHPEDSLASEAERRGVSAVEAFFDISDESDGRAIFLFPIGNHDFEVIGKMLSHPRMLLGLADSGAHCGQIMDASLPTYLLSYWVRERELFPVERAIEKLTSEPAAFFGIEDRGVLREGAFADLNIIDFDRLKVLPPEFVHDLPGGSGRFIQKAEGFRATLVNGEVFLEEGKHSGTSSGRVLRR
ncbi:MAG: amidohydrolase family protein [bacterium]|nr:amidohydrolase family protein [bacterium]